MSAALLWQLAAYAAAAAAGLAALAAAGAAAYYIYCLRRLRALSRGGAGETADFIFGAGAMLVGPLQHRSEIMGFIGDQFREPPKAVAEIGRAQGGTLALLCRAAAPDALVVSLDLPGGAWAGQLPALNRMFWRRPLLEALRGPGQQLRLIDGDSRSASSVEKFAAALAGKKLDVLFIDGDHTFDGVKSDYELYSPFVKPGGVIAFHDIQAGYESMGVEVSRFWREYPLRGERREYIADPSQLSCGIGSLRLPL